VIFEGAVGVSIRVGDAEVSVLIVEALGIVGLLIGELELAEEMLFTEMNLDSGVRKGWIAGVVGADEMVLWSDDGDVFVLVGPERGGGLTVTVLITWLVPGWTGLEVETMCPTMLKTVAVTVSS
jgi:hypothetical protein